MIHLDCNESLDHFKKALEEAKALISNIKAMHTVTELSPGQGVTITDKTDLNHKRDGFVRESKQGPYHQSLDTNEYKVWFEPGEQDYIYKGTQLEPNDQHMDSSSMPEEKK